MKLVELITISIWKTEYEPMGKYVLSNEGRMRFTRRKMDAGTGADKFLGYEVLDCLFENGSATVKEIEENTGLSWEQVNNRLTDFISRGYIEEQVKPRVT